MKVEISPGAGQRLALEVDLIMPHMVSFLEDLGPGEEDMAENPSPSVEQKLACEPPIGETQNLSG